MPTISEELRYIGSILDANKDKFTVPDHIPRKAARAREAADVIDKLTAALEFYADIYRWDDFSQDEAASVFDRNTGSEFGHDRGKKAYAALSLVRQEEKG